jgi:hypothetical protein
VELALWEESHCRGDNRPSVSYQFTHLLHLNIGLTESEGRSKDQLRLHKVWLVECGVRRLSVVRHPSTRQLLYNRIADAGSMHEDEDGKEVDERGSEIKTVARRLPVGINSQP